MLGRLSCLLGAIALLSCGSTKAEVPVVDPPSGAQVAEDIADMSPVLAPKDLLGVVRVRQLSRLVDVAAEWAGFPLDWRALLATETSGPAARILGAELERILVPDAPMDAAIVVQPMTALEPKLLHAFSVGVTSVDAATAFFRNAGDSVEKAPGGLRRVRMGEDLRCLFGPARGPAPARIVCGTDEADVTALWPYMARGLPEENLGAADLHARLLVEPLRRQFGAQLKLLKTAGIPFLLREIALDHAHFDRALKDALYVLAEELLDVVGDLDRISADVTVNGDQELIEAVLSLQMSAQKSLTGQFLVDADARSMSAPAEFWQLPVQSGSASYGTRPKPQHAERLIKPLVEVVDGFLAYLELNAQRRDRLVEALEKALMVEGASVHAEQSLTEPISALQSLEGAAQAQAVVRRAIGHYVIGVEQEGGHYAELLDAAEQALLDRSFRSKFESAPFLDGIEAPTLRKRALRGAKRLPQVARLYELSLPGSYFEPSTQSPGAKQPAKKPSQAKPLSVFIVLVPEATRTWIGISADEQGLYEQLAIAVSGEQQTRLDAREGLDSLRTEKSVSAGFSTLASIANSASGSFVSALDNPSATIRRSTKITKALAVTPHQGATPIVWRVTASADGPAARFSLRIPKFVVEDLAAGLAAGSAAAIGF